VQHEGGLCPDCWKDVRFLGEPCCRICAEPFEFDVGGNALCARCVAERPPYAQARALFAYDHHSSGPILAFKHGDRPELARAFARWVRATDFVGRADMIVPVPLHWSRLFARRYNQAALFGRELARLHHMPMEPLLLLRHRRTPSQGRRNSSARVRNVRDAFSLHPVRARQLEGKTVLLVDDVITTGATVAACSRILLEAGVSAVLVLAIAKVVRGG
jgi:ComF family protein